MGKSDSGRDSVTATMVVHVAGRPVAVRVRPLRLRVTAGPEAGLEATLSKRELSVGSHRSNDLVIDDATVSRFHFRVRATDRGYRIVDEGSANGTIVNGVPIRDGFLVDGARVDAGTTTLVVSVIDDQREIELSEGESFGVVLGRSIAMREVFALAARAAPTSSNILLLGETGTGKGVLARAIHAHSPRAAGPFVVLDCGAVSATLIESELFGHVRGAFTGAVTDRAGVFEQAAGGTLFLDEIGELPLSLQPKLLRALESGTIVPVGSTQERVVDGRIICATNQDLRALVGSDQFRSDLYYRIAVVELELPPLRDRREDIPLLAGHFLRALVGVHGRDPAWIEPHLDDLFAGLTHHRWPGNVRELRNVVERAAVLLEPNELDEVDLSKLVDLRDKLAHTKRTMPGMQAAREQFDREYLRDALAQTNGDVKRAAELAQIHPKSFERLLRRYGVSKR